MRLFLDPSVVLAASGSTRGASREVFRLAPANQWTLIATPYVVAEVRRNLPLLASAAYANWIQLQQELVLFDDVLTLDRATFFHAAKDRPILFSALAWADVLLTLDRNDFGSLLGGDFYGLKVLTPGMFLEQQREEDGGEAVGGKR